MATDFFTAPTAQLHVDDGLIRLPGPDGERFAGMFRHGTLLVELYAPRGHDPQTPHARDEIRGFSDDLWVMFYGPEGGGSGGKQGRPFAWLAARAWQYV